MVGHYLQYVPVDVRQKAVGGTQTHVYFLPVEIFAIRLFNINGNVNNDVKSYHNILLLC